MEVRNEPLPAAPGLRPSVHDRHLRGTPRPAPGRFRRLHGQFRRMVRLRRLRLPGRGHRRGVLPAGRQDHRPARRLRGIRPVVHRPSHRRHRLGPYRRPLRPAQCPFAVDPDHVRRDLLHRPAAHLRPGRPGRTGAATGDPPGAGLLRLRRIRRRRGLPRRVRTGPQARLLHLPGASEHRRGPAVRLAVRRAALYPSEQRTTARMGLAPALPARRAAGSDRPLHSPAPGRHAEIPRDGRSDGEERR
ncbi:hypothetical protein D9M71_503490 [compost metagenome]